MSVLITYVPATHWLNLSHAYQNVVSYSRLLRQFPQQTKCGNLDSSLTYDRSHDGRLYTGPPTLPIALAPAQHHMVRTSGWQQQHVDYSKHIQNKAIETYRSVVENPVKGC